MKRLKEILKKDPSSLSDEEKQIVAKHWDILNDDIRKSFADCESFVKADGEEEENEDNDDEGIDEKTLKGLISDSTREHVNKTADNIAKQLVDTFQDRVAEQRKAAHG